MFYTVFKNAQRWYQLLRIPGSFVLGTLCGLMPLAVAQIHEDTTLSTPSTVTATPDQIVIRGGTQRGTNLFHSFRQFSVSQGTSAVFLVDRSVANIFSRITGSTASKIDGTLQVLRSDNNSLSPANFFLLNPNGILFGRHASLNVGGSFLATTANRLDFADGTQFSATQPQTNALLTVQVPTGLQFGDRPGDIVNRSSAVALDLQNNPQTNAAGLPLQGLSVPAGQTLALIGGDILVPGNISVQAGRIELGSVAQQGQVGLMPLAEGWRLRYDRRSLFGEIRLQSARLDTSGTPGGAIHLQGGQIRLNGNSQILSTTTGSQSGRPLTVHATDFVRVSDLSTLRTQTQGTGAAGNIRLSTRQLTVQNNGSIGSFTVGAGQGGTLRIAASDAITIGGDIPGILLSRLTSQTASRRQNAGDSGNIDIRTDRLQVLPGGQIRATTFGAGDAGNIHIRAGDIVFAGTAPSIFDGEPVEASSGLFAAATRAAQGNGGAINIVAQRLSLSQGALVQASTYGSGNAGDIVIDAAQSVDVAGASNQGHRSGILASSGGLPNVSFITNPSATGRGGSINITTESLRIRDAAVVAVNSLNSNAPGAGTLQIQAQLVSLDNHAQLNAQTESAGANIGLPQVGVLLLRRQSRISTNAGTLSRGGTGGNIDINGDFVIAAASENSDITANAVNENAGNVRLNANVVGISPQQHDTPYSDITATSEQSVSGTITISQPQTDPTRSLVTLPTVFNAAGFIAQQCSDGNSTAAHSDNRRLNSFVITGQGGLPPSPADVHSSNAVLAPWATLEPGRTPLEPESASQQPSQQSSQADEKTAPIAEAQGWITNAEGKVELVTQTPTFTGFPRGECPLR